MGGIKKQGLPEEISTYIGSLEDSNKFLENRIKILEEELQLERNKRFGNSSEKVSPLQSELFEEFEQPPLEEDDIEEPEEITISGYTKRKGRKPIDSSLPREEIIHDIPEEDKQCACGCEMSKVDEVITERLQIIPEKSYVEKHIRPKYACRNCEGSGDEDKPTFRIAPAPPSLLPGSIMTGGLLAYIHTNKFCDYLPFYRQEKRFERYGIPISRQNMSNWTIKAYRKLKGLNDIMKDHIKTGTYLQMDETVLKVHGEEGKLDSSNSYIWVTCGGPKESGIALYEYNRSRSSKYIKDFTEGFSGFCQSDGYPGYNAVFKNNDEITHVSCLAHCRRELIDAYKASKQVKKSNVVINKIQKIYVVEKQLRAKNLKEEEFVAERKKLVTPLLENLKDWLDKKVINIRPESKLGKAIKYTLGQWDKVINYLDCADLTPDNNAAERIVKPLVMGRKNFLFSGSPEGADALCFFYSLIETAKLNGLNPYAYLKFLFDKAPLILEGESLEELAPWKCDPTEINKIMMPV